MNYCGLTIQGVGEGTQTISTVASPQDRSARKPTMMRSTGDARLPFRAVF
jgi:hypothetical protein